MNNFASPVVRSSIVWRSTQRLGEAQMASNAAVLTRGRVESGARVGQGRAVQFSFTHPDGTSEMVEGKTRSAQGNCTVPAATSDGKTVGIGDSKTGTVAGMSRDRFDLFLTALGSPSIGSDQFDQDARVP